MSEETAFSTSDDEVETTTPVAERNAAPHLAALGEKARDYARNARAGSDRPDRAGFGRKGPLTRLLASTAAKPLPGRFRALRARKIGR